MGNIRAAFNAGVLGEMMRYVVAAAMLLSSNPAVAQLQVPGECAELAAREGFPADMLTKTQAASASVRLARLSDSDPLV